MEHVDHKVNTTVLNLSCVEMIFQESDANLQPGTVKHNIFDAVKMSTCHHIEELQDLKERPCIFSGAMCVEDDTRSIKMLSSISLYPSRTLGCLNIVVRS